MTIRRYLFSLTGYTMVELLIASAVSVLVFGGIMSFWISTQRIWQGERLNNQAYAGLQTALERVKLDLLFTDGNKVIVQDDGISLPRAKDNDGDGCIELDGSDKIIWDETVIYHVWQNEDKHQLLRTVFNSWNESASTRETQLNSVINSGGDDSAVTRTMIAGLNNLKFIVDSPVPEYDGYSGEVKKSEEVSFGRVLLDPGYHTVRFEVTDKNPDSSGCGIGLDTIKITPCGYSREAEGYISLVHLDDSTGISSSSGDTITKENMTTYGCWGGNYQLAFNANVVGDYIELRVYYDLIRETNFVQGSLDNTTVEFTGRNGYGDTESGNDSITARLVGYQTAWDAAGQTGGGLLSENSITNKTYRVVVSPLSWDEMSSSGKLVSVKFRAGDDPAFADDVLIIKKAYIGVRDGDTQNCDVAYAYLPIAFNNCNYDPRNSGQGCVESEDGVIIPAGKFAWSNFVELKDSSPDENGVNFDESNDYLITFYIEYSSSVAYWQGGTN